MQMTQCDDRGMLLHYS